MNFYIKSAKESGIFSKTEMRFLRIIFSGIVLNLIGKPGIGKSAIISNIANKMDGLLKSKGREGFQIISVPLPAYDETDLSGLPYIAERGGVKVFKHAKAEWAIKANEKPTVIFFDEANRASQAVKNATMKLIYERCIDDDFYFNDNVFFALAGNLGEEDGTEVEEMDAAFLGRMVTIKYNPPLQEWVTDYAHKKVARQIVSFLEANPSMYYHRNDDDKVFASPRSWTTLNRYVNENTEGTPSNKEMFELAPEFHSMVGNEAGVRFASWLETNLHLNIKDIITNFGEYKDQLKEMSRPELAGLGDELLNLEIQTIKDNEDNVCKFIAIFNLDHCKGYQERLIRKIIDSVSYDFLSDDWVQQFLRKIRKYHDEFYKDDNSEIMV